MPVSPAVRRRSTDSRRRTAIAAIVGSALLTVSFVGQPVSAASAQNLPPAAPAQLTTYPATACGSATHPTLLSASVANASFTARLTDPDGNNLAAHLEIRNASDGTLVHGPVTSATVPSGSPVAWPAVPSGVLASDGTLYSYRARAQDSKGAYGPYTDDCYFSVDTIRPGAPTITSTDYPEGAAGIDAGTVGLVTITPAPDDTDIAGYQYGFDDTVSLWAPADATGTATIPITLWGDPDFPGWGASADLWVTAVDRAGNRQLGGASGPHTLYANDTGATVADRRGDINGDGRADVAIPLDMGQGRTAVWTFISAGSGFHPPTIGWDSGINGGHTLDRIKTVSGDFDNDGRADIALFRQDPDGQVRLFNLRSDTNQYRTDWGGAEAGTWALNDARVVAGDFTGDGIDDVAAIVDDQAGGWTAHVYPSTSGWFSTPADLWHVQGSGTYAWTSSQMLAGDFTGDGKADLAVVQEEAGGHSTIRVHASTGSGFAAGSQWWDSSTDADPAGFAGNSAKYVVGNVTGSGADDIIALDHDGTKTSVKVLAADGNTFASPVTWWDSDTGSPAGWNWGGTTHLTLGDFDNDGHLDLAAIVGPGQPGQAELWRFPNTGTGFGQVIKQGTIGTP